MGDRTEALNGWGLDSWAELRRSGRDMVETGVRSFAENDLLSFASAIAFQVLFALVPFALAAVALLGFLDLEEVWQAELAPQVQERVQDDAFSVIDRTVEAILGDKRAVWLTFGLAFALWQVSGAIRATSGPLNLIYGTEDGRPFWRRLLLSFALALAIGPLLVFAGLVVQLGPRLVGGLDLPRVAEWFAAILRWGVAGVLLLAAVWLLIRFVPSQRQSFGWTGVGAVFVVVSWLLASLGFGLYATYVADYGSVFGGLASVIVLMTYLYVSSVALLFGVQLDACVRQEVHDRTGLEKRGEENGGKAEEAEDEPELQRER